MIKLCYYKAFLCLSVVWGLGMCGPVENGWADATQKYQNRKAPARILFLGNSYTSFNGGLAYHVQQFAQSAEPGLLIETAAITPGGYTLENHWNTPSTIAEIQTGYWDMVILQEQSTRPVTDPDLMFTYARNLETVISGSDAETGFFMTWAREYDPPMIEPLAEAYNKMGLELNALVAAVGRAFQQSLEEYPELTLHNADGSHPNVHGTYLATCVLYATIWANNPVGVEYVSDPSITAKQKTILQSVAWHAVSDYLKPPGSVQSLTLEKLDNVLSFKWTAASSECHTDSYALYAGDLPTLLSGLYNHDISHSCSIETSSYQIELQDPLGSGNVYFLVVALNEDEEGSYGSGDAERPISAAACENVQVLDVCQ
ncbi:hypothetical protein JXQ70_07675 [bacterium]|nr:hypothetical protein [bacterium]